MLVKFSQQLKKIAFTEHSHIFLSGILQYIRQKQAQYGAQQISEGRILTFLLHRGKKILFCVEIRKSK